jgi:hypothetical protein
VSKLLFYRWGFAIGIDIVTSASHSSGGSSPVCCSITRKATKKEGSSTAAKIPGGQDADVTLTFDQYRHDQNVYLHHEERKDAQARSIDDGLTIISRPDQAEVKEEFAIYAALDKLSGDQREALELKSLQEGKLSTRRLFVGDRRGVKNGVGYDDAGVFIRNRLGRDAIKLYVDYDNKPHLEVYDELGKSIVYDLKVQKQQ